MAGADTYQIISDVQTYATRYGLTFTGTDEELEQAIIRAMDYIEEFESRLHGCRVSGSQELSWPRYNMPNKVGGALSSSAIPKGVKNALAEAAILERSTANILIAQDSGVNLNVKREKKKVGPLETETEHFAATNSRDNRFERILAHMRPYLDLSMRLMEQ